MAPASSLRVAAGDITVCPSLMHCMAGLDPVSSGRVLIGDTELSGGQAVLISAFGALLGLAVGVGLACAVQGAAAEDGLKVLSVPAGRLLVYVVVSALIGVVAAIWPAGRAARMDVLRAIGSGG